MGATPRGGVSLFYPTGEAAVHTVGLVVLRADGAAEAGALDRDVAVQDLAHLDFLDHRLAQLAGQRIRRNVA